MDNYKSILIQYSKEEIKAQLTLLDYLVVNGVITLGENIYSIDLSTFFTFLTEKLKTAKSIEDLEEAAFEAGRLSWDIEDTHGAYDLYNFEDYLKTKNQL